MTEFSNLVMQVFGVGGFEWVIIIIIGIIVFFGVKKIPELARSFGKATSEFEKARIEAKRELQQIRNKGEETIGREKLESIAETLGIDYTNKNDDELRIAIETEINKNKNKNKT
jgi:sec-independent protein translocase protein TatA